MARHYSKKIKLTLDSSGKDVTFSIMLSEQIVVSTRLSRSEMEMMMSEYRSLVHEFDFNNTDDNQEEINTDNS